MTKPQRFRKKPVEITAIRYDGWNSAAVIDFMGGPRQAQAKERPVAGPGRGISKALVIHTLEGDMNASVGDWIIRGVQGEFYPCKPDIFAATYDSVE